MQGVQGGTTRLSQYIILPLAVRAAERGAIEGSRAVIHNAASGACGPTCCDVNGKYHSPFASAAAVRISCSTLAESVSCCSVCLTIASTSTMTVSAMFRSLSLSAWLLALSLRVAMRIQNLASKLKMLSATNFAT